MSIALILGREADLAAAEAHAVLPILAPAWTAVMIRGEALLLEGGTDAVVTAARLQERLGGTVKACVMTASDRDPLAAAYGALDVALLEEGKREVGLTVHGRGVNPKVLVRPLKTRYGSLRLVMPTEGTALSSVQVLGNRLAGSEGAPPGRRKRVELVLLKQEGTWHAGTTVAVQDIEGYRLRDFGIPAPDAVSGMLPPKLARAMVNLAARAEDVAVYDPFCGNGRIPLEADAMGFRAYGSDIDAKKVEAATENLAWFASEKLERGSAEFWKHDATAPELPAFFTAKEAGGYVIAAEPYLGPPLRAALPGEVAAAKWLKDLLPLYRRFLGTWSAAPHPPRRMVLVVPRAAARGPEVRLLDHLLDDLRTLKYRHEVHASYGRPDALVRRDIVELQRTATHGT